MRKSTLFLSSILIVMAVMSGCATGAADRNNRDGDEESLARIRQSLNDLTAVLNDSEFSIVFPTEHYPAIRTLSVLAKGESKIIGWAHSSRRSLREAILTEKQYTELVAQLRALDFRQLREEDTTRCDVYTLKIRVGTEEARFTGCRKASANSTVISKLAHTTQFYVLSGSSKQSSLER